MNIMPELIAEEARQLPYLEAMQSDWLQSGSKCWPHDHSKGIMQLLEAARLVAINAPKLCFASWRRGTNPRTPK